MLPLSWGSKIDVGSGSGSLSALNQEGIFSIDKSASA
jgi:hypothetical protein